MVSGWLKSFPPARRNPQGAGPCSTTLSGMTPSMSLPLSEEQHAATLRGKRVEEQRDIKGMEKWTRAHSSLIDLDGTRRTLTPEDSHPGGLSPRWTLTPEDSHPGGLSPRWTLTPEDSHPGGLSPRRTLPPELVNGIHLQDRVYSYSPQKVR
ncbi:hypothetical protein EYF80_000314 [Liparis tanakae]|uniref:Uncharacterized protein n=1 Tax=Liparis tanakae TaxID=230148 RepID=A0A4Z2JIG0_9TELE|nr:hypothetical protein EYF80_000314 [Liparis tanakae]